MKFFVIIKDRSERVKNKNFRVIGDKPLYLHLLDRLPCEDVYINTDSDRVNKKFNIIKRDERHIIWEHTRDDSPVLSMIEDFLINYVDDDNEIIVTPHVTSPFLTYETILKACKHLDTNDSIVACTSHKEFAYINKDGNINAINFDPNEVVKTQNLDPVLFQNGAFFAFRKKTFMDLKNRVGKNPFFYILDYPESIEIDYETDLTHAIDVYNGRKK